MTKVTGTLLEDVCRCMITRWILLRIRTFWDKFCRENQNTNIIFNDCFSEARAVYEITWKNMVELERPRMAIQCGIACWMA